MSDFEVWQSAYPRVFPRYPCCGFNLPPGWTRIVQSLCFRLEEELARTPVDGFEVEQVKEKFGGLRFYVSSATADMEAAISDAELASLHTCERCGGHGERRPGGWIRTLCEACHV